MASTVNKGATATHNQAFCLFSLVGDSCLELSERSEYKSQHCRRHLRLDFGRDCHFRHIAGCGHARIGAEIVLPCLDQFFDLLVRPVNGLVEEAGMVTQLLSFVMPSASSTPSNTNSQFAAWATH